MDRIKPITVARKLSSVAEEPTSGGPITGSRLSLRRMKGSAKRVTALLIPRQRSLEPRTAMLLTLIFLGIAIAAELTIDGASIAAAEGVPRTSNVPFVLLAVVFSFVISTIALAAGVMFVGTDDMDPFEVDGPAATLATCAFISSVTVAISLLPFGTVISTIIWLFAVMYFFEKTFFSAIVIAAVSFLVAISFVAVFFPLLARILASLSEFFATFATP